MGDKILSIDTAVVSGRNLPKDQLTGRFKGKSGTGVSVVLLHPGAPQSNRIMVTRGKVNVSSIDAAYMINNETGYVRISKFGANTDNDFSAAANNLKAKGMKKLILDLRDNGGGYFTAATGLADQFWARTNSLCIHKASMSHAPIIFLLVPGLFKMGSWLC